MTKYVEMCQAFARHVDFRSKHPIGSLKCSPFDGTKLARIVTASLPSMPRDYAATYGVPLAATLPSLTLDLKRPYDQAVANGATAQEAQEIEAQARLAVDTLVGACRDWSAPAYRAQIQRFEAVVSNFYRSFLSASQRAKIKLPLIETVPPLVTFAPTSETGPFTLTADAVAQYTGVSIGIVSIPGGYRDHPLLWPILAHECGGHDVLAADPGLVDELGVGVAALPHLPPGAGRLWEGWMDEAASDVYGLLNVGPAFAVNLAASTSAMRAALEPGPHRLGPISNKLRVNGIVPSDGHPVDLLRIHLAIGVTAQLTSLSASRKLASLIDLQKLAKEAAGGATTIDVFDEDKKRTVQKLPLQPMAEAAQAVGGYIATARLDALQGHSIQDIETWDDDDDIAAQTISVAAGRNTSLVNLGDDAQLLAGTTMALLAKPSSYQRITKRLVEALDDSFNRDPDFAPPAKLYMTAKPGRPRVGAAYSRSPRFPTFPLDIRKPSIFDVDAT